MSGQGWIAYPAEEVGGGLRVPGDKSISHRTALLGAVAGEPLEVSGFLESGDCLATLGAVRALGAGVRGGGGRYLFDGAGPEALTAPAGELDLGNSGTGIRLLCGLLAGLGLAGTLTGDASLRRRPMERIAAPLRGMGARIRTAAGHAPIVLEGGGALTGIDYEMPVASAQVKSALLLAGLFARGRTRIRQPGPCRDHTERLLQALGVPLAVTATDVALDGPARVGGGRLEVPGDFSSAAFFLLAGLLRAGPEGLLIEGVGVNPTRTGLLDVLRAMGGRIELCNARMAGAEPVADLRVHRSRLAGIAVPEGLVPLAIDEFPVIFVAASLAEGRTRIRGAAELRHKESDRIEAMARALGALGAAVVPAPDGADITGGALAGGHVDSVGDHRVAMAMAVAALAAEGPVEISDTANVATSFPGFTELAGTVGLTVEQVATP